MLEPKLSRIALFAVALTPWACKPRADQSAVKHTFGETRRDREDPQQPCVQVNLSTKTPVADAYIRKLAAHMAATNPKTMSGAYAFERFCFALNESDEFNAMASARFMLVTLNRPILKYAASDAEVASVLAHEIAHVVMRHDVAIHPDVESLADVQKLIAEAKTHEAKVKEYRLAEEGLANERRAFYQGLRQRLTTAHPAFAAAVSRMETLNSEALALVGKEPVHWGVPNDPLPTSQMSSFDDEKLSVAEKKRYAALREEYAKHSETARTISWKDRTKAERETERSFFDRSMKASRDLVSASGAASDARGKIDDRTVQVLGQDVAANWAEAEADEVGYELYLRAGFIDEGYTWINRVISQIEIMNEKPESEADAESGLWSNERALEECLKARKNMTEGIVRGAADHPASCWRLSDIRVKENQDHAVEYAPLKAAATAKDLPGTPTLAEAQREIEGTPLAP